MNYKTYKKNKRILALVAMAVASAPIAKAADIYWTGPVGSSSYNSGARWSGGKVPGTGDNAVLTNGIDHVVQINSGDPDWSVNSIRARNGAFEQNGQILTLTDGAYPFNLGIMSGDIGVYTLNSGAINYNGGTFSVGELGAGTLNMNGGSISGSGSFAVNIGGYPSAITASMDGGTGFGGTTWYEMGYNPSDATVGLPAAGATFVSTAQADHSYMLASSYRSNNAVLIDSNINSATLTLKTSAAYSGLSFLGSAGNGNMTVNYTVHHADSTTETGVITFVDWFTGGTIALGVGGRCKGDGTSIEKWAAGGVPYLYSIDVPLTSASAVTTIDLAWATGTGHACLMAVSGNTGTAFAPIAITGYNADMVVEAGAATVVSTDIIDTLTQTAGAINITNGGQFFVGNVGNGVYNLSGGSLDVHSYIAFGRAGGNGTVNMTGGTLNQDGGGNLLVGTGYQAPASSRPSGVLNQSGGTINSVGEFLIPENSPSSGAYTLSGTGALNASNYFVVGRSGGKGTFTMTGGTLTKTGNGNIVIGASTGNGVVKQSGGTIVNTTSLVVIGNGAQGDWTMTGGTNYFGQVNMCGDLDSGASLTLKAGLFQASGINLGTTAGTPYCALLLDGGTVQATMDNSKFISGIYEADVLPGGAVIDSQAFNITVPQVLVGAGGGVIKKGSGTLTLTGANSFAGAVVNAGTLVVGTDSTGAGDYTVANNAGLGVTVAASLNSTLVVDNLTLGASTLNFDMSNYGNPTTAPVTVSGAFAVNGNITVNIADALPQLGSFPLVQYGTRSGAGNFVIGTLPTGVVATISTNGSAIVLNIGTVNVPRWDGNAGGNWDLGLTQNWINIGTGLPAVYNQGNPVLFDDTATGTTTVNVAATVNPSVLHFNNTTQNYTVAGSGKIGGSVGLTKDGNGSLALNNTGGNTFTGPVIINAGTLSVSSIANGGSASALGASSASPTNLVLSNSKFSYTGPAAASSDRGYSILTTNCTIDAQSDFKLGGSVIAATPSYFLKTGPALFTYAGGTTTTNILAGASGYNPGYHVVAGTVMFDGSNGHQTNRVPQDLWVGGTTNTGGSIILSNTTLFVDTWFALGRGNGTVGNVSTMNMYNSLFKAGNVSLGYANGIVGNSATQYLTMTNSILNSGALNLGENGGSVVNVSMNGNSSMTGSTMVLGNGTNGIGTLTMNNNSTITNTGDVNWASGGGKAVVTINGNSVFSSNNRIQIGLGGSTGTVTVANSGSLLVNGGSWFSVGNENNANVSLTVKDSGRVVVGGDFNVTDTGTSTGSMTVQDNAFASGNAFYLAKNGGTVGTLTMSGGTLIARGGDLRCAGAGQGTWNQTGGTVIVTNWGVIARETGGVGVYNLSGGTLMKISSGSRFNVGERGTGTLNVSGTGSVLMGDAQLDITSDTGNGTINLNGGSITANRVTHVGSGPANFNFNGGTLIAGNNATLVFMNGLTAATVKSGGAKVDTGTNSINIGQALLDGTDGGGLTKTGNGTLRLNGVNTYTGLTTVSAGTLAGAGTIAGSVTVAPGATLAAGNNAVGTLTIKGALTLAAGSTTFMKVVVGSNDQISGLTGVNYAGALVVTNTAGSGVFKLFNSAAPGTGNFSSVTILPGGTGTFNPATGELTVAPATPPTLNPVTVSGGNLNITGAGGVAGSSYSVLTSTNVAAALSTWTTNTVGVFGNNGTFTNAIPLTSTNSARFFLIKTP